MLCQLLSTNFLPWEQSLEALSEMNFRFLADLSRLLIDQSPLVAREVARDDQI